GQRVAVPRIDLERVSALGAERAGEDTVLLGHDEVAEVGARVRSDVVAGRPRCRGTGGRLLADEVARGVGEVREVAGPQVQPGSRLLTELNEVDERGGDRLRNSRGRSVREHDDPE